MNIEEYLTAVERRTFAVVPPPIDWPTNEPLERYIERRTSADPMQHWNLNMADLCAMRWLSQQLDAVSAVYVADVPMLCWMLRVAVKAVDHSATKKTAARVRTELNAIAKEADHDR